MKTKFAILGAGKLGQIVARAWKAGKMPDYELVGIFSRTADSVLKLAEEVGVEGPGSRRSLPKRLPWKRSERMRFSCWRLA